MLAPEIKSTLKDGTDVTVFTTNPCDKKCLADGFDRLSARTRQLRFFSPINKLSDAQLSYLTDVDNVNHVVIAAADMTGETPIGLGLARYIRLKQHPGTAEFAMTVIDAFQGRGVGSILLDTLIEHARTNSIGILRAYILKSNTAMRKLLEHRGARCAEAEGGSLQCDLHIDA